MLVWQALVQRAVDGESTYAAVKDADGKGAIADCGLLIADFRLQNLFAARRFRESVFQIRNLITKSAIRIPQSEILRMVEAPRIELGSKRSRRKTLHA